MEVGIVRSQAGIETQWRFTTGTGKGDLCGRGERARGWKVQATVMQGRCKYGKVMLRGRALWRMKFCLIQTAVMEPGQIWEYST